MALSTSTANLPRFLVPGILLRPALLDTSPHKDITIRRKDGHYQQRRGFASAPASAFQSQIQAQILRQKAFTFPPPPPPPPPSSSTIPTHHYPKKPISAFVSTRRAFHATPALPRDHHFDTLKFVQRLKNEGFSEEQAVAMMRVLSDVIEEAIQNLTRTMVLKEDAERSTYTQKVDFAKLRSELLTADSSESKLTRDSLERLTADIAKLNSRLRDDISRTQASVRLDLNLEKGRIREEANVQDMKIKETETRIEQEVAGLKERVEGVKFSTLQWLM
ncbi:MAG: hypothetical protein M1834_005519 [Cirrosporium novae-zelandiae]|nr:MAG: hypothetical protein M1834_005519 [Cirrosporium novae-zelandiae]